MSIYQIFIYLPRYIIYNIIDNGRRRGIDYIADRRDTRVVVEDEWAGVRLVMKVKGEGGHRCKYGQRKGITG